MKHFAGRIIEEQADALDALCELLVTQYEAKDGLQKRGILDGLLKPALLVVAVAARAPALTTALGKPSLIKSSPVRGKAGISQFWIRTSLALSGSGARNR